MRASLGESAAGVLRTAGVSAVCTTYATSEVPISNRMDLSLSPSSRAVGHARQSTTTDM